MKKISVVATTMAAVIMMAVVLFGFTTAGIHAAPKLSDVHVAETSASPRYEIQGTYGRIQGASAGSVEEKANRAVDDVVDDEIRQFKAGESERAADLAEHGNELKGTPVADAISELDISSTVETVTSDLLSLRLTFSSYHAGAAHGMMMTRVINYDLAHGVLLTRSGLFRNEAAALKVISAYAQAELDRKAQSADEQAWIAEGTDPANAENLQHLALTPQGLLVIFDAYEVDCYAAGQQEVLIPLNIVSPFLTVSVSD